MGLQGLGFFAKYWVEMMAVAFIVFGVFGALSNIDDDTFNKIFVNEENNMTIASKGEHFLIMAISFSATVPAYRYNLPFTDQYIVGINDIPYFDLPDLILLTPLWLITMFFMKRITLHPNIVLNYLFKFLIIVKILILGYLIVKAIEYQIYLYSASRLGIPQNIAIQAREDLIANTEELSGVFAVIAILTGLGMAKKLKDRFS